MKKNKKLVLGLIAILAIVVIFDVVLVLNEKKKDESKDQNDKTVESVENEEQEEENEELYVEDTKGFDIKTSYGNLQFPEAWKDTVKAEITKDGECETVEFWAELEGKDKVHIFDVIFGADKGYLVGMIKTSDDKEVSVCVESYSYDLDDSWSDSDKKVLAAIDHDINFLLDNITSLEGFTSAE